MLAKLLAILCFTFGQSLYLRVETHGQSAYECIDKYADSLDNISDGLGAHIRQIKINRSVRSSRSIVFGAGSGTTATTSLRMALKLTGLYGWHWNRHEPWTHYLLDTLGGYLYTRNTTYTQVSFDEKTCHRSLQEFDFATLPSNVEYVLDEPVDELLVHLLSTFPNAKFIMTTRPSLEWAAKRRLHHETFAPLQDPCGYHVEDFPDDNVLARLEDLKRTFARCIVPKDRLLEFSVFTDSDERIRGLMAEIGAFIGRPFAEGQTFPGSKLRDLLGEIGTLPGSNFSEEKIVSLRDAFNHDHMYNTSELGLLLRELAQLD